MDAFIDILKITLPAVIVLYAVYLIVKSFLQKQFEITLNNLKRDSNKEVLPLRLQAYERMAIFLERITPNNLITRLNDGSYNVSQFQNILTHEIRQEYNHNLSQQIYMSDEAWELIRKAKEDMISIVNNSARECKPEGPSVELAKKIFELVLEQERDSPSEALNYIKKEIRDIF
ncbi:hypothetical protein AAG747_14680 [Rapidithrix thailandica]|uniref:Uncharacterized protein n=1 Tax=Rapidithrix thailandica TaxID=413964 RepID=A0AAW9S828_9BACT